MLKLSTGKRTEEGWLVYKEDELGISSTGGGKLPTAFNCSLFTVPSNQTPRCVHLTVIVVSFLSRQSDVRIKKCLQAFEINLYPRKHIRPNPIDGSLEASISTFHDI